MSDATTLPTLKLPECFIEDLCAKKDVRFYLNTPYLDLAGERPLIVSCTGAFVTFVEVDITGDVIEGPLSVEAIKAARRADRVGHGTIIFDRDMMGPGDVMYRRPDIGDLKFPDWRAIVPKLDDNASHDIAFNAELLAAAQKALGKGNKYGGCKVYLGRDKDGGVGANLAMTVKPLSPVEGNPITVVMPMRG